MELTMEPKTQTVCPECNTVLPNHHGFVTWCDKCNWNVLPSEEEGPQSLFDKLYLQIGKRTSEGLLASMLQNGSLRPGTSIRKILTLFLSSLVHLLSLALFLSGVYIAIATSFSLVPTILGAFLLLLSWAARPRGYKLTEKPLPRDQFPALYRAVDEISSTLAARKVHGIVVNGDYNASFAHVGLGRKKIIHLGYPLICTLNNQELTALISHEVAHGINGDLNRGLYVSSAINTLSTWYQIIKPGKLFDPDGFFLSPSSCFPSM